MDESKEYNSVCVNEVINILETKEIELKDFRRLEDALKWHRYYEEEEKETSFADVIEYLNWNLSHYERERILDELNVDEEVDINELVGIKTLDDVFKFELLMKLFKTASSTTELESWIKPEILEKVKFVDADV